MDLPCSLRSIKRRGPEDFTMERCKQIIEIAIGSTNVESEILSVLPWEVPKVQQ